MKTRPVPGFRLIMFLSLALTFGNFYWIFHYLNLKSELKASETQRSLLREELNSWLDDFQYVEIVDEKNLLDGGVFESRRIQAQPYVSNNEQSGKVYRIPDPTPIFTDLTTGVSWRFVGNYGISIVITEKMPDGSFKYYTCVQHAPSCYPEVTVTQRFNN